MTKNETQLSTTPVITCTCKKSSETSLFNHADGSKSTSRSRDACRPSDIALRSMRQQQHYDENNVYLEAAERFEPAVTLLYFENGIGESK